MSNALFNNILVIINPVSGTQDEDETVNTIETYLGEQNVTYDLRTTQKAGDALEWAKGAAGEGFDLVIVAGGDGTVVETITGVIKSGSDLPVLPLVTGTASLIARATEVPADLMDALELLVSGKCVALDVGYVSSHDKYFALITGAGWDAQTMADAPRELKRRFGFGAYVLAGIRQAFKLRQVTMRIMLDDEELRVRAHTVLVVNIGRLNEGVIALGADVFHHDGKLNVIVASEFSFARLFKVWWRRLRGRDDEYQLLQFFKVDKVRVETRPNVMMQLDGDPLGETPFEAEVVPDGVRILVPDAYVALDGSDTA